MSGGGGGGWRGSELCKLTLEGSFGAARGSRLRALQLPGLGERAFGIRASASDQGRGEHPLCALLVGGAGPVNLDRIKLLSITLLR